MYFGRTDRSSKPLPLRVQTGQIFFFPGIPSRFAGVHKKRASVYFVPVNYYFKNKNKTKNPFKERGGGGGGALKIVVFLP